MAAAAPQQQQYKHFSHTHALALHHTPIGSQVNCSGCRSRATGCVYACWTCNYFLHEACFRATRTLNHPSHAAHPLTLHPYPTYPSASFVCNSCGVAGNGFCYACSDCDFDLHLHCAQNPNPNPNPNLGYVYPPVHTNV